MPPARFRDGTVTAGPAAGRDDTEASAVVVRASTASGSRAGMMACGPGGCTIWATEDAFRKAASGDGSAGGCTGREGTSTAFGLVVGPAVALGDGAGRRQSITSR